ncbi:unnamed protein product [Rotaria sp. Silwood1]|nr:unnamed protein product [Rotaria sp. Silwood1]CAF3699300.1 unnamed protein product [Rotaria sp. Silwood1]CAF3702542.1 unnamed protein product [Rotaria sp. Silwood1]CAF4969383.1 unnamed protein product [Rotaria sp. Silwood1]CAF4971169.1 unnamed protein product [Rotaria sp. Silwood1]
MSFNYSSIINEQLSRDDPLFWSRPTPVDCNTIRIVGIFLCMAAFIGIVFNGALFYNFIRYKILRSPPNIFVMFIAGMGLIASCTILPLTGTSSVYCQWLYKRAGCQLSAMIAFLYGCSSSYLLCGASLSRCYIIIRPFQAKYITVRLKRMREKIEHGIQTVFNRKRIEMERRILKSIIITTSGFIFTWTPYAVTLFVSAFRGKDYAISPMATFFCACFAKTSVIWIPMFYVATSTHFQLSFINRDILDQSTRITRIDRTLVKAPILLSQKNDAMMMKSVIENNHDA